eukprot:CAMPEP_0198112408 /NCGR_PEP_ID=MMETSP1442-20131203/4263_1 /TAXON_ID= /ORGANISM="Craspedostauros australis, Strain CCMP3328" /LENGTH=179 /DNA_ID=CAMNT_0043769165 /DNA_START=334 /DNA_END=870 /DNA_ORIENTATION=+
MANNESPAREPQLGVSTQAHPGATYDAADNTAQTAADTVMIESRQPMLRGLRREQSKQRLEEEKSSAESGDSKEDNSSAESGDSKEEESSAESGDSKEDNSSAEAGDSKEEDSSAEVVNESSGKPTDNLANDVSDESELGSFNGAVSSGNEEWKEQQSSSSTTVLLIVAIGFFAIFLLW